MKRCAALLFFLAVVPLSAREDLTSHEVFVRRGFLPEFTAALPDPNAKEWLRISPDSRGFRSLRVRELPFPDKPVRTFLSPFENAPEDFTYVLSFFLDPGHKTSGRIQGLYLAHIGVNWEIYVNGHLVRSEIYRTPDGKIQTYRSFRGALIPLNPLWLRDGENVLAFHIVGDPTYVATGFYRTDPYVIDDLEVLSNERRDLIGIALIALYASLGAFHVFLYLRRKSESYNLHFGIFAILLAGYFFARSVYIFDFIRDTSVIVKLELGLLFLILPTFTFFAERLLVGHLTIFAWGTAAVSLILVGIVLPAPLPLARDILNVWQGSAAVPLVYALFITFRDFYRRIKHLSGVKGRVLKAMVESEGGNLILGVLVTGTTTAVDILDSAVFGFGIGASKYGFFVFVAGVALMVANRFLSAQRDVERLNTDLKERILAVDEANRMLAHSEKKYRVLVEGSADIVFSLDRNFTFLSINRAVERELGFSAAKIQGQSLFDLVEIEADDKNALSLLREKLDQLVADGRPATLKIKFRSNGAEGREYSVRMESMEIEGRPEIVGKAVSVVDDGLVAYFDSERQRYVIGHSLITAEELSQRMLRNATRYLDAGTVGHLRICLREMIINAIEHGNLAITSDEKSRELTTGDYRTLIRSRQNDERYRNRSVVVEYALNAERIVFRITDQGAGFDVAKMEKRTAEEVNAENMFHGRGILLTRGVFDEVMYNRRGNQVVLVKRFQKATLG